MLYYIRSGSVDTTLTANSPKQAAIKTVQNFNNSFLGRFIIVGTSDLDDESTHNTQMFFSTDTLINDHGHGKSTNMKLVY